MPAGPKLEPVIVKSVPPDVARTPPGADTFTDATAGAMYATALAVKGSDGLPPVESEKEKALPTPAGAGQFTYVGGVPHRQTDE